MSAAREMLFEAMLRSRRHWTFAQRTQSDPLTGDGIYRGQYSGDGYLIRRDRRATKKTGARKAAQSPFDLLWPDDWRPRSSTTSASPDELLRRTTEADACAV